MKNNPTPTRLQHLGGYLLIPHELLHLLGFWLVGVRCRYRWGQPSVTPLGSMSRRQHLVGVLLPFLIFLPLFLLCALLAGFAAEPLLREGRWFGFALWLGLTYLTGFYICTTLGDLRQAYLILSHQSWPGRTPLDWMFYPIVDWAEIRRREEEKKRHAEPH